MGDRILEKVKFSIHFQFLVQCTVGLNNSSNFAILEEQINHWLFFLLLSYVISLQRCVSSSKLKKESGTVWVKMIQTSFPCSYIFWLGDLNYRFEDLTAEVVKFLSSPKKLHVLREKDQLLLTIRGKRAFDQFQEGALSFVPTYKYDLGQNTFDSR